MKKYLLLFCTLFAAAKVSAQKPGTSTPAGSTPWSVTAISPSSGSTGTLVTISGFGFNNATSVKFGGVEAASFTVMGDTMIKAVVGAGASGVITVTTPFGIPFPFGVPPAFSYISCNTTYSVAAVAICSSQLPYAWNGNAYNAAGSYTFTLTNAAGCDSIATLNLTVIPQLSSLTVITICNAQLPYSWNGNAYNTAGSYVAVLVNAAGCDSVATLNLSVIPAPQQSDTINVMICDLALPYLWNGQVLTAEGIYSANIPTGGACDSIAYLKLNVAKTGKGDTTVVNLCPAALPYTWNQNSYSNYGTYAFTIITAQGCDSIAYLQLRKQAVYTGGQNGNWETAANWNCNQVTDAEADVVINSGSVIINANTTIRSLTVAPSATITVSPGVHLTVLQ